MPRRDGTGPLGKGAMTGLGLGFCKGGINTPYNRRRVVVRKNTFFKFFIPVFLTGMSYVFYKIFNRGKFWKEVKAMPRGDGTGPLGEGPMTGGGRGFCNTSSTDNSKTNARYGLGLGLGFGRGRGYGRRMNPNNLSTQREDKTK